MPGYTPYLASGQLAGAIFDLGGAAEFELLSGMPGRALINSNSLSLAVTLIIFYIIVGNIIFFLDRFGGGNK